MMPTPGPILIGLDIGTTNIKAVATSPSGDIRHVAKRPTVIDRPGAGFAEFNLPQLGISVVAVLKETVYALSLGGTPQDIVSVAVASFGESFVGLDAQGDKLTPCPTWFDRRTSNHRSSWGLPAKDWFNITGMVDDDIYTAHRLAWWRQQGVIRFNAVRHWLLVADYVTHLLTGKFVTAPSIAARSGMADRNTGTWSKDILRQVGIDMDTLCQLQPAATVAGWLTGQAASVTGLPQGTPVINAGHDHPCAAFGCGLVEPGPIIDSTGTSEAIKTVVRSPLSYGTVMDGAYDCYPHVIPDRVLLSGHLPASGSLIDKLQVFVGSIDNTNHEIWDKAAQSPFGARGIRIRPYLEGTGAPWNRRSERMVISGLGAASEPGDIMRAGLEALAAWVALNLDHFETILGKVVDNLLLTGGVARNKLYNRIKADFLERTLIIPDVQEAAGLGAAFVGGCALGSLTASDVSAMALGRKAQIVKPNPLTAAERSIRQDVRDKIMIDRT